MKCARRGLVAAATMLALSGCAVSSLRHHGGSGATMRAPAGTQPFSLRPVRERRGLGGSQSVLPHLDEGASLSDYLTYAALNNPGLEAAFERWQAALAKVPQARALPDPRLTYGYFIQQVETRAGPQSHKLGLAQTFPWPGKLGLRAKAASAAADAAWQRYESDKLKLFYAVKHAYYEYYHLARAVEIVEANRELLKYVEQVVRTRYKVAAAAHPDVIRAQVELGKLDDRVRTLADLRGPIVARLNAALNRPPGSELPWPQDIPAETITMTDRQVLAWLPEANPDLKALEHRIAERQRGVELAGKNYYPDFTVGLDYIQTDHSHMMGSKDSGKDPIIAMVSINLPIWREKYRAAEREARARLRAAVSVKIQRQNALSSEIKMVLYRFRDAERKMSLYEDTLLPRAKQSLKATEVAFRAGTASFLDLIDTERVLLEFELSRERAVADRAQRLAELDMLVGKTIPRSPEGPAVGPAEEEREE